MEKHTVLVLATGNAKKAKEVRALLPGLVVHTLAEHPHVEPAIEDAETFTGNAVKKAEHTAKALGIPVLADDSGLCVDALGGAPGVRSARYAEGDDRARWEKLLRALADVPASERTARFVCALALAIPGEATIVVEGTCEGTIAHGPSGEGGFGYDPVFVVRERGVTMAELSMQEKNVLSHRARALTKMRPHLEQHFLLGSPGPSSAPSGH
ncbi:RdgB/HAM1 family non-canonical purine NTP pyrophosphatase [Myxococcota bacterium]|nr:RdgB/HAM1 family non-canonical purine NTP pyrophosphatase [Myxococcota bacterium]